MITQGKFLADLYASRRPGLALRRLDTDVASRSACCAAIRHHPTDLGQPAEARQLAEQALAIIEAGYGPDHPTTATLQANISRLAINRNQSAGENPAE